MKIAYLISVYKDPPHLRRLIKRLLDNNSYFFIHVDLNVDIKPFQNALDEVKNVGIVVKEPFDESS